MKRFVLLGVVIMWIAIIFYLSQQPASKSSQLSSSVAQTIEDVVDVIAPDSNLIKENYYIVIRKQAHFLVYFVLGILLMYCLKSTRFTLLSSIVLSLAVCVFFAIIDETLQLFALGRGAQVKDVFIDTAGASIGIIIYTIMTSLRILIAKTTSNSSK